MITYLLICACVCATALALCAVLAVIWYAVMVWDEIKL